MCVLYGVGTNIKMKQAGLIMHYNVVRTLWSETSKHQRQGGVLLYRADLSVLVINMCVSVRDVCVCVYDIIFQQSVCLSVFPLARLHGQTFGKKMFPHYTIPTGKRSRCLVDNHGKDKDYGRKLGC